MKKINEKIHNVIKSKLFVNSAWLFLLQGFNTIVPLITIPYVTRVLGPSMYGEFVLALNWIGYLQIIVEYGFGMTGSRNIAIDNTKENVIKQFSNIILSRLLLLAVCSVVLVVLVVFVSTSKVYTGALLVMFLMVVSTAFQQTWLFQGMQQMKYITIINVICRTVSVVLIFALVHDKNDIYIYCFLYCCNFLVSSAVGVFVAIRKFKAKLIRVSFDQLWIFIKDGWYLFVSKGITQLFSGLGVTVLGLIADDSVVGAYGAIQKIPMILIMAFSPIGQALFPISCKAFSSSKKDGFRRIKQVAKVIMCVFCCLSVLLIIFREEIVLLAFGQEYTAYSDLVIPLLVWALLSILNNFLGIQCLVGSGNQKQYSKDFTISVIFLILFNLILGIEMSEMGIAIAACLSELSLTLLLVIDIKRLYKGVIFESGGTNDGGNVKC